MPFNDLEAVEKHISKETAAIIIEPIQGEGGINEAKPEFLEALRELCDKENIVLIFDEIHCGVARTGKMFAWEHSGVKPDIMTLAKGLGGGVPIGAILSNQKVSDAIDFGDHGTTFGGNPLACAASLAVFETIENENLLKAANNKGAWLRERTMESKINSIKEIRGKGLMMGVEFDFETKPLVLKMMENGVLANATAGNVLRLVPPLVIDYEEMNAVVESIKKSLKQI